MTSDLRILLRRLRLTVQGVIDENDSFQILRCQDERGAPLVLKYMRTESRDAYRRLKNEALLTDRLPARAPLRLLAHRDHGPRYLLTEYDSGTLLRPRSLYDRTVLERVAQALIAFQSTPPSAVPREVVGREPVGIYYVKVMLKHLIHLLPAYITWREAAQCVWILVRALPAIARQKVVCHGDFLPTNLLHDPERGTITITDLEGFMSANHPLFDVLALFTIDDGDALAWHWQPWFLRYYLANSPTRLTLDPASREFESAYRGILIFFLAYRLNEARINLLATTYFEGRRQWAYIGRKLFSLARHRWGYRDECVAQELQTRRHNLLSLLSKKQYLAHIDAMRVEGNGAAEWGPLAS